MKNSNNKVWQPNSIIYNFGDEPKCAFLIISGTVEFYSKNDVLLGSAGQTEVFGEISCYLNKKHSVTAKAKTHLAAKIIPKLAKTATRTFFLKTPTKTKNSPTNPLVPGNPMAPNEKIINISEYFGIMFTNPP